MFRWHMLKKHVSSAALATAAMFLIQQSVSQAWPPTDFSGWLGLILGITLLIIAFFAWKNEKEITAKEIAYELSGGNNFCYFNLYLIQSKPHQATAGQFTLGMQTVGGPVEKVNYWISPYGLEPTGKPNDPYYSLDFRKPLIEIIHAGGRAWDRALALGDYRIDFSARNGNWYERLRIYMSNGEVKQSIKVTRRLDGGEILYDSEAPPVKPTWWNRFMK